MLLKFCRQHTSHYGHTNDICKYLHAGVNTGHFRHRYTDFGHTNLGTL